MKNTFCCVVILGNYLRRYAIGKIVIVYVVGNDHDVQNVKQVFNEFWNLTKLRLQTCVNTENI